MPNPNRMLLKILSERLGRYATRLELNPRIKMLQCKLAELTEDDKKNIADIWNPIGDSMIDFNYWRFYKTICKSGNNPCLVPDNIYWSRIIRALNPSSLTRTYINKSLYPIIFKGLKQPGLIINVINGIVYDHLMNIVSPEKAIDIVANYGDDIIIKPTTATSGGSGVSRISRTTSPEEVRNILSKYGKNYICQGAVRQSASTAAFNASSLNTFRVNTVNINGQTSCTAVMMRHGTAGSVVDNFAVGGVVCGMTADGEFNGNNFNTALERISVKQDGTPYDRHSIPAIKEVIDTAIDAHQRFMPHIGHAAWDFAIDENESPVMIEVNLMLPGILMEQLTAEGSIFGQRTQEVIRYAINRNPNMRWTEFVGGWQ